MKSIFLSVVVISALLVGGIGGTLATWSDSETSEDNYIETGSVDLKVNDCDDEPWGTGVLAKIDVNCVIPCKIYGPFPVDVWNAGQCTEPSELYIHLKDYCCDNAPPKPGSGYPDPLQPAVMKPEPELVAEYGGKVNCTEVPGVGIMGDNSTLAEHIYVWIIKEDPNPPDTCDPAAILWEGKMDGLICNEVYLCDLEPCNEQRLYFWIHLQQPSEEDFGLNFIPNDGEPGYDPMTHAKFNDWPSWALMKDATSFDTEFDLWLVDP
jgi:predicted ribosomally synthesized peptide with SipW-like signal peptide